MTQVELLDRDWLQLAHSVNMVAALPDLASPDLPKHIRHAVTDAFGVHARLVADVVRQTTTDQRLDDLIHMVDHQIVGFGSDRINAPVVSVDIAEIRGWLLPLVPPVVTGHEPLASCVDMAIAGDYPRE